MSFRVPCQQWTKRKVSGGGKAIVVYNASPISLAMFLHPALCLGNLTCINCIDRISAPSGFRLGSANGELPGNQRKGWKWGQNIYFVSLLLGCHELAHSSTKVHCSAQHNLRQFSLPLVSSSSSNGSLLHPSVPVSCRNWADIIPCFPYYLLYIVHFKINAP